MKSPSRLSGLQYDVLALYRSLLRAAVKKSSMNSPFYLFVRSEFREKAATVSRLDFVRVEHMIRQGKKQLHLIQMPGFSGAQAMRTAKPSTSQSSS
eukprot:gene4030-4410_t